MRSALPTMVMSTTPNPRHPATRPKESPQPLTPPQLLRLRATLTPCLSPLERAHLTRLDPAPRAPTTTLVATTTMAMPAATTTMLAATLSVSDVCVQLLGDVIFTYGGGLECIA
ncbi:hypothetical protein HZ326_18621, partial [Fusarium oxysporum f. sp. albedinis]